MAGTRVRRQNSSVLLRPLHASEGRSRCAGPSRLSEPKLVLTQTTPTVRVRNSAGDDGVISADEWLARVDALRDDGWHR